MERTALIAYEDTPQGRDGVALGRLLCEAIGARPLLATIVPWPSGYVRPEDLDEVVAANTRTHFDPGAEMLAGLDPRSRAVVDQSVGLGLLELSRAEEAILLVFGSSHRGSVGRTLIGSAVESVLHDVAAAVAVAPLGYSERPAAPTPTDIGVAYDGSIESRAALETAVGLARGFDAQVTLIGVADYPRYDYAEAWMMLSGGGLHDFEREASERALQEGIERIADRVSAATLVLTGSPGPALAEASDGYDMLVAGSRGRGPLHRTLLGSTTRRLLASSSCPVLVMPRGAGDDPLGLAGS